jgi:hypothetical protein
MTRPFNYHHFNNRYSTQKFQPTHRNKAKGLPVRVTRSQFNQRWTLAARSLWRRSIKHKAQTPFQFWTMFWYSVSSKLTTRCLKFFAAEDSVLPPVFGSFSLCHVHRDSGCHNFVSKRHLRSMSSYCPIAATVAWNVIRSSIRRTRRLRAFSMLLHVPVVSQSTEFAWKTFL